jgi:hypothetical protein
VLLPKANSADPSAPASSQSQSQSTYLSQYARDAAESIKNAVGAGSAPSQQQQPQPYMSQYAKEATESIKNAVGIGGGQTPSAPASRPSAPQMTNTPPPGLVGSSGSSSPAQQQHQRAASKVQRSKLPPPSKVYGVCYVSCSCSSMLSLDPSLCCGDARRNELPVRCAVWKYGLWQSGQQLWFHDWGF